MCVRVCWPDQSPLQLDKNLRVSHFVGNHVGHRGLEGVLHHRHAACTLAHLAHIRHTCHVPHPRQHTSGQHHCHHESQVKSTTSAHVRSTSLSRQLKSQVKSTTSAHVGSTSLSRQLKAQVKSTTSAHVRSTSLSRQLKSQVKSTTSLISSSHQSLNNINNINPLTARVVGAPQMILQPVFSIFPVLHCPLGLDELQACPFPDVVFPPLPLSALSSSPFHCALQDGFGQT